MTALSVQVTGAAELQAAFDKFTPSKNPRFVSNSLKRITLEVQTNAASFQIRRGGGLAPAPTVLTSRTGTLRRAISTDFGGLPFKATVGNTLKYAALHESGGRVNVPRKFVKGHFRTKAFGKTFPRFRVKGFFVNPHKATFPKRPWLQPAVDAIVPRRAQAIVIEEWEGAAA